MKCCEITYEYDREDYTVVERAEKGFEDKFEEKVLNRIESLLTAEAKITNLVRYYIDEKDD